MINIEFKSKRKHHVVSKIIFIVGGLLFAVTGILKLIYRDTFEFDTYFFISAFNILVGVAWLVYGLNIINLSEKSKIRIDEKSLYFNPSLFDKTISLMWDEIESIEIKRNKLNFKLIMRQSREIELGWIPQEELIVIRNEIQKLTKEKNIDCKRI